MLVAERRPCWSPDQHRHYKLQLNELLIPGTVRQDGIVSIGPLLRNSGARSRNYLLVSDQQRRSIPAAPIIESHLSLYLISPYKRSPSPMNAPTKGIKQSSPKRYGGFDLVGSVAVCMSVLRFVLCQQITANVRGLPQGWYLLLSARQLKPIKN